MGPSGSGKTSLLKVLAQRVPQKDVTGGVFVDGSPLSKSFKKRMGFVFQVRPPPSLFRGQAVVIGVRSPPNLTPAPPPSIPAKILRKLVSPSVALSPSLSLSLCLPLVLFC